MTGHEVPVEKRLLAKRLITESGCWEFQGTRRNGYGRIWWKGSLRTTHRVSAALWLGLDIDDLAVNALHRCDNPAVLQPGAPVLRNGQGQHAGHDR